MHVVGPGYLAISYELNLRRRTYLLSLVNLSIRLGKGANQPVFKWLKRLWYPQPTRDQILVLAFIKFQDDMPAQFFGGAHRGRDACVRS